MTEAENEKHKLWEKHGPLIVSPDRHFLQFKDGTPFFWLGDTAWRIVALNPEEIGLYIENRFRKRFNVIQINATNFGIADYKGRFPFLGSGPPWGSVELNEEYWAHLDYIIDTATEYGMHILLFTMWGYNAGAAGREFFSDPAEHNYQFAKLIGERYKNRPNVLWSVTGEYDLIGEDVQSLSSEELHILKRTAEGLFEACEGKQLFTYHPLGERSSSTHWHKEEWLSFNMIQSFGHMKASTRMVSKDYYLEPVKPVINGEPGYEDRHKYRPDKGIIDSWHLRMEAYTSLFSGAFGYTYGHVAVQHFGTHRERGLNWKKSMNRPGAGQMQHVRRLMESKPITKRVPDQSLVTSEHHSYIYCTRGTDKPWAFVYSSVGEKFTCNLSKLTSESLDARWYDPRKGRYISIGQISGKKDFEFTPPGGMKKGNDWVLVLDSAT